METHLSDFYLRSSHSVSISAMKPAACAVVVLLSATCGFAPWATAQTGAIDLSVRATPASGMEEPVRGFPVYLLSKSYEQIAKEAEASYPPPDMNAFIDKLGVSKELKAWMKKNHWVQLSGDEFLKKVKPEDVIKVPEFYSAFVQRSDGAVSPFFPKPKYKPADKTKDPAKYQKLRTEYNEAVERYIDQDPDSKNGMDLDLADIDPGAKWQTLTAKRGPEVRRRTMDLAQSTYFVARAETNLQGDASISRIPPGTYWLSTLDLHAQVGDVRPQWDVPVTLRAGQTVRVLLSNFNAMRPADSQQ